MRMSVGLREKHPVTIKGVMSKLLEKFVMPLVAIYVAIVILYFFSVLICALGMAFHWWDKESVGLILNMTTVGIIFSPALFTGILLLFLGPTITAAVKGYRWMVCSFIFLLSCATIIFAAWAVILFGLLWCVVACIPDAYTGRKIQNRPFYYSGGEELKKLHTYLTSKGIFFRHTLRYRNGVDGKGWYAFYAKRFLYFFRKSAKWHRVTLNDAYHRTLALVQEQAGERLEEIWQNIPAELLVNVNIDTMNEYFAIMTEIAAITNKNMRLEARMIRRQLDDQYGRNEYRELEKLEHQIKMDKEAIENAKKHL